MVPATTLPPTLPATLHLHMSPRRRCSPTRDLPMLSPRPQSISLYKQALLVWNIITIILAKNPTLLLVTDLLLLPLQLLLPDHHSLSTLMTRQQPPMTKPRNMQLGPAPKAIPAHTVSTFPTRFVTSTTQATATTSNHLLSLNMEPLRVITPMMNESTRMERTTHAGISSTLVTMSPPIAIAGTRVNPSPIEGG